MTHAVRVALFAAFFASFAPRVQAQNKPVRITLRTSFQGEDFETGGYTGIVATLENRTGSPLRGTLFVTPHSPSEPLSEHTVHVDLPAHATRTARLSVFTSYADAIGARFVVDDAVVGETSMTAAYGAGGIVLLLRPARIRASAAAVAGMSGSGSRADGIAVFTAAIDPRSGDPEMPSDAVAYRPVDLVVTQSDLLLRLDAAQRSALLTWVRAGGRLLVFPHGDRDLADPFLRALVGNIMRVDEPASMAPSPLVPQAASNERRLKCESTADEVAFGCARRVGFGAAYVTFFDGNEPTYASSTELQQLLAAVWTQPEAEAARKPILAWAAAGETARNQYGSYPGMDASDFLGALEPRGEMGLSLLGAFGILVLYVVSVGPLNFWWVRRKSRPMLAFATTPALSAAALALMFSLAVFQRGVIPRYRRLAIAEAVEGETGGIERRWTGLHFSWPSSADVDAPASVAITPVPGIGTNAPARTDHLGDRTRLRGIRGSLWETVFLREDRAISLGQGIEFVRENGVPVRVVNHSPFTLRGALFVITPNKLGSRSDQVYRLGELPPGRSAAIGGPSETFSEVVYASPEEFRTTYAVPMGLTERKQDALLATLQAVRSAAVLPDGEPFLLARVKQPGEDVIAGRFVRDQDLRFLRIAARPTDALVRWPLAGSAQGEETQGEETGGAP